MPPKEENKIFTFDFNLKGQNLPVDLIGKFTEAQAKVLGLRGTVEKTAEGLKGNFQGEKVNVEKIKDILQKADQFKAFFKDMVTTELKEIKEYTEENFKFKKS